MPNLPPGFRLVNNSQVNTEPQQPSLPEGFRLATQEPQPTGMDSFLQSVPGFKDQIPSEQPFSTANMSSADSGMSGDMMQGAKRVTREALPYAIRPALETIPSMAGAALGTPGGPGGMATGGALGYATGKTVADRIEQWAQPGSGKPSEKAPIIKELGTLGNDLMTGLTFELGGAVAAKTLGVLMKTPGFIKDQLKSRFPAVGEAELEKRAAQIIKDNTSANPQYLKNIAEADAIAKEIPGYKMTLGDRTGDPSQIKFQRGLEAGPGPAADAALTQRGDNVAAIKKYLKQNFEGNEGVETILKELESQKKTLGKTTKTAETTAGQIRGKVTPETPQTTGRKITKAITEAKKPVTKIEKEYWDKVPNYEMNVSETEKAFKKLASKPSRARNAVKEQFNIFKETPKTVEEMHVVEQELNDIIFSHTADATEKRAMGIIKKALNEDFKVLGEAAEQGDFGVYKGKVVHPKQLQKRISEIDAKLQKEGIDTGGMSEAKPDIDKIYTELQENKVLGIMQQVAEEPENYAKRLVKDYEKIIKKDPPMLQAKEKAIVTHLKQNKAALAEQLKGAEPAKNAGIAYANAKAYSTSQNFGRFGEGAVLELRQSGKQTGGTKITPEKRPLKLKSTDSADQFIKALGEDGKKKAGDIMLRHYADDMSNSVKIDDQGLFKSASLNDWVKKNKRVLDKYGIAQYFDDTNTAHKSVEIARKVERDFNKSIAAKMLDSDPDNVIEKAFTGGEGISAKNTSKIMQNIMEKVSGNEKAVKGLENAFQDFLYRKMETTSKTIKGDNILGNATLAKAMRRFKPAIKELYRGQPTKIKALKSVEKALEISSRSLKSPMGGGSDTAEKASALANVMSAIATKTPYLNSGVKLAKLGLGAFKDLNKNELNKMIVKLMHDPELAETLIFAAGKKLPPQEIKRRLSDYMVIHGIRMAKQAGDE